MFSKKLIDQFESNKDSYYNFFKPVLLLAINLMVSFASIELITFIQIYYQVPPFSLIFFNYLINSVCLILLNRLNAFKYSKLPIIKILPVTFSYFFYLILNEYSLTLNTIASYQLFKGSSIIFIILISSSTIKLTLVQLIEISKKNQMKNLHSFTLTNRYQFV